MTQCPFKAKVVVDDEPDECNIVDIQCANQEGHVADHLILVSRS